MTWYFLEFHRNGIAQYGPSAEGCFHSACFGDAAVLLPEPGPTPLPSGLAPERECVTVWLLIQSCPLLTTLNHRTAGPLGMRTEITKAMFTQPRPCTTGIQCLVPQSSRPGPAHIPPVTESSFPEETVSSILGHLGLLQNPCSFQPQSTSLDGPPRGPLTQATQIWTLPPPYHRPEDLCW